MTPATCNIALKEWAIACRALDRGEQIILLRKGGIHEDGLDFRVVHRQFLLYPSFEHQRQELIKPQWFSELADTIARAQPKDQVTFSLYGEATELHELLDVTTLDRLGPLHLWTANYAQSRLHWKPSRPLTVMVVRAHRITPVTVPVLPRYNGCTSWVDLAEDIPLRSLTPVLSEANYSHQVDRVRDALHGVPATR
jgi:hypothetical protein